MKKKLLTKAEEEIMQIIWEMGECSTGDVLQMLEKQSGKRPAHSTVSTMLGILVRKQILDFRKVGNSRLYTPKLKRDDYLRQTLQHLSDTYFGNSINRLVSFLVKSKPLDEKTRQKLIRLLEEE